MKIVCKVKFISFGLIGWLVLTLVLTACAADTPVPTKEPVSLQQPFNAKITPPASPTTDTNSFVIGTTKAAVISAPTRQSNVPVSGVTPDIQIPPLTRNTGFIEGRPNPTIADNPNTPVIAEISYLQAGDLWVISEKGTNKRQLTRNAGLTPEKVRWSPTAEKVAYFDNRNALHVVELKEGSDTVYYRPSRQAQISHQLEWSPNGRYIAFDVIATTTADLSRPDYDAKLELATKGEIWLIDAQSPTPNALKIADGFNFAWSPDSRYLAYPTRARKIAQIDSSVVPVAVGTLPPVTPTPNTNPEFIIGGTPSPQATTTRGTPVSSTTRAANSTAEPRGTPTPIVISAERTPVATTPAGQIDRTITPKPSIQPTVKTTVTPVATYNPNRVFKAALDNNVVVWEVASRTNKTILESAKLPAFPAFDGSIYPVEGTAVQGVWWSPDGKNLVFADQISFVGSAVVVDNSLRMWLGQPRNFALNKIFWLPGSSGTLLLWNNYVGEARSYFGTITTPGVLSSTASDTINCPAMSPAGNLLAYASATDTLVVKPDGTTIGGLLGGGCPAWSPDGTQLIAPRRATDGSLVLFTLDGNAPRQLIGTRAVDFVFWVS